MFYMLDQKHWKFAASPALQRGTVLDVEPCEHEVTIRSIGTAQKGYMPVAAVNIGAP